MRAVYFILERSSFGFFVVTVISFAEKFLGTYETKISLRGSFQEEFSIGEQLGHSWGVCRFADGRLNDNNTKTQLSLSRLFYKVRQLLEVTLQ